MTNIDSHMKNTLLVVSKITQMIIEILLLSLVEAYVLERFSIECRKQFCN